MANRYSVFQLQSFLKHAGDKPKFTCVMTVSRLTAGSSDAFLLKEAYTLVGVRDSAHLGWRVVLKLAKAPKSRELLVSLAEFKRCFTHEGKAFRKDVPPTAPEPTVFIVSVDTEDDDDTEQFVYFDKLAAIRFALSAAAGCENDGDNVTVTEVKPGNAVDGGKYIGRAMPETSVRFKNADGTFFVEKV